MRTESTPTLRNPTTMSETTEPPLGPTDRVDLLGVSVDNLSFEDALDRIIALSRGDRPRYVVTPNVDHVMRMEKDARFREAYAGAALVLTDGMPLVWAAKLLGTPVKAKVSGSDLTPRLAAAAAEHGRSVYFLGGHEGAAEECAGVLTKRHPTLTVAGTACPPMGFHLDDAKNRAVIEAVRAANPDILFVGLGSPKQELWIHRHHEDLGVPVSLGIGASIDFVSGRVKRAPRWMQKSGLEWLHRLGSEPRRLWRRYLLQDSPFVWRVMKRAGGRWLGRSKRT